MAGSAKWSAIGSLSAGPFAEPWPKRPAAKSGKNGMLQLAPPAKGNDCRGLNPDRPKTDDVPCANFAVSVPRSLQAP
jgi:hypothetical protein